ncbi:MAG: hypothetical protein IKE94_07370 [Aeriscardovia sp.]|nr:hypothetical protein [Aeriscardovia sp.]
MNYIVIYDIVTREVVRVIPQSDKIVSIGYSDNCMQKLMAVRPKVGDTI